MFLQLGLYQCVTSPTHLLPSGDFGSLLDLVLVSDVQLVEKVCIHPAIGKSDHLVVSCLLVDRKRVHRSSAQPKRLWCYEKADFPAIVRTLNNLDWSTVHNAPCVDSAWSAWLRLFLSVINSAIPSKVVKRVQPKIPWMSSTIEQVIKEKRAAFRRFKRDPSSANRAEFNQLRNKVTHLLRKAARAHATSLHRQTRLQPCPASSSSFWEHMKSVTGKVKSTVIPDLHGPSTVASTDAAKASLLNSFFADQTVLSGADSAVPDESSIPANPNEFTSLHCTPSEVYRILSSLDCRKAPGLDGITPLLLRECASGISVSLALLFNRSFSEGQFPSAWKQALVMPVFKKGDRHAPGNYRPISLLSMVSKVQEKVVHVKLSKFLSPWLSDRQSGFKRGDSTTMQLTRLVQLWSEAIDDSSYVGVVFFDLKKAFDRVWHQGLLAKLERAGVRGQALHWFSSFLSGRRQVVSVNGSVSAFASLHAGVPQGAILSPLLFSLYMNDIHSSGTDDINLFADDTSMYVIDKSACGLSQRLQKAVDDVSTWFSAWLLSVNSAKSAVMVLRSSKMRHFSVGTSIGGQVLPQVSTHRHLGLILHECLSWSPHIQSVVTKVSQRLGLLFRLRNQLPALVTRELYVTCIRPVLEYSSIVWSGLSQTDSSRLERLNRRAARLITRCSRLCDLPHPVLLARAGLQELSQRRRLGQALFTFRFANVNLPAHILDGLAHWLPDSPSQRPYLLRREKTLRLPRARKNTLKHSPLYSAFSLWNSLPPSLLSSATVQSLKAFFS